MMAPLLLDTCATIWIANEEKISTDALAALEQAHEEREPVFVSPITAWEVGLLASRGRVSLLMTPGRWFARVLQAPGVQLADMPPAVLVASSFLPGAPPNDPADRILAATAREFGYRLMTRDRSLLAYAAQGHIQCLSC